MAAENKDEWSHWLQIWPLESTASALSFAIYYIHEYDLRGARGDLKGEVMGAHLLHSASKSLAARRSNRGLLTPLCSPPFLPVTYRRRLTHFPVCVCVLVGWMALQGWTKASHLHLCQGLQKELVISGAVARMQNCFSNGISWPCQYALLLCCCSWRCHPSSVGSTTSAAGISSGRRCGVLKAARHGDKFA